MTGLTTHVLDTALGLPAEGLRIDVYRISDEQRVKLKSVVTNKDGRIEGGPILAGNEFRKGHDPEVVPPLHKRDRSATVLHREWPRTRL